VTKPVIDINRINPTMDWRKYFNCEECMNLFTSETIF
jgi:hypothetical protein